MSKIIDSKILPYPYDIPTAIEHYKILKQLSQIRQEHTHWQWEGQCLWPWWWHQQRTPVPPEPAGTWHHRRVEGKPCRTKLGMAALAWKKQSAWHGSVLKQIPKMSYISEYIGPVFGCFWEQMHEITLNLNDLIQNCKELQDLRVLKTPLVLIQ